MKFEVLHTEGCSGYEATERNLREALAEEGVEAAAEVEVVEVRTDEEARRLRFLGSPTVRASYAFYRGFRPAPTSAFFGRVRWQ